MKCPNCESRNYACLETRNEGDSLRVRRYRCNGCDYRFKTEENIVGVKHPNDTRFTPIGVAVRVDGREILDALRKPMADVRRVLRSYDDMLK